MFNIEDLDVINGKARDASVYSFVGIKRNQATKRLELWLPLNFDAFPIDDKKEIRKFFFLMYKTLRTFTSRHSQTKKYKTNDRDGVIQATGGIKISYSDNEDVICYGKISMIESVIDSYDEMIITSVVSKAFHSENITDFSKINKYIDKAIYLEDDLIYIDKMQSYRNTFELSQSILIEMYCFIYVEIKAELFELNEIKNEILHLAEKFKIENLKVTSSIFGEYFEETTLTLKGILDDIYRRTSYKDRDFWIFFDAIEIFLYGELYSNDDDSGEFWGINNFWAIWEDMCHTYSLSELKETIIYSDTKPYANYVLENKKKVYLDTNVLHENIFFLEYFDEKRYLYPDMIRYLNPEREVRLRFDRLINIQEFRSSPQSDKITLIIEKTDVDGSDRFTSSFIAMLNKHAIKDQSTKKHKIRFDNYSKDHFNKEKNNRLKFMVQKKNHEFIIVDYKYHSNSYYFSSSDKLTTNITKQYVYELAIRNWHGCNENTIYKHQFCIPIFTTKQEWFPFTDQPEILLKNKIELIHVNFSLLQEFYIKNGIL